MESSKEDGKRPREDQEAEANSSKNAKVKMAPSAFRAQSGKTITNVYSWEKNFKDLNKMDGEISDIFGTKKHSFYLSLVETQLFKEDSDEESDQDSDDDRGEYEKKRNRNDPYECSNDFHVYLNLDKKALENEVFIKKLFVKSPNTFEGPKTFHNEVLTKDSPLEIDTVEVYGKDDNYFETNLEITFKELGDDWNSYYSTAPVNHAEMLCRQLANVTNSSPADVTLKTMSDGQLFPAHKLILKMRSPVFAAMFSNDFVENQKENPIEIFEVSGPVMKAMLAYVYCKPFNNWETMAGELAVAADMYNIQSLFDACIASLLANLTVKNAAKNFYYAQFFNSTNVKRIAEFINIYKSKIKLTDGWKELTEERGDWLEKQLAEALGW